MDGLKLDNVSLMGFCSHMNEEEKSQATIEKYVRDVKHFIEFSCGREVTKALVIEYKEELGRRYAVSSANSMIAALNHFLRYCGFDGCCVKQFRLQRQVYCPEEKELTKEEYVRLVNTARALKNRRLELIIQTICGTGIRVSELRFITAEAVRGGSASVTCKRKTRTVFIPERLRKKLRSYCEEKGITEGAVFVTGSGRPVNRCSIWREMKSLCSRACVPPQKVFPHNLRHLFARTFYNLEKDISKLADLLGHSSLNTTRIYIMESGRQHRMRIERMHLIL